MRTLFLSTAFLLVGAASLSAADLVGQAKVDELMTRRLSPNVDDDIEQLNAEIDRAANARYAHLSGLYWHTDLAKAKKVASAERKPILTLRLMGRLDEELSCANSRYFRLLLYPDEHLRKLLHDRFVLHWHSVRPAAVVTIDLGDGRTVRKTLTGNSVHYVILPNGDVIDAFPGLFAPQYFCQELKSAAEEAARHLTRPEPSADERAKYLEAYTDKLLARLLARWHDDIVQWRKDARLPHAESPEIGDWPRERSADDFFRELGALHPEFAALGATAESLVKAEQAAVFARRLADSPGYAPNLDFAFTKNSAEQRILPILRNLRATLAADTACNDYILRRYLHDQFREGVLRADVEALSRRFYESLGDPWRGLANEDVFNGLPDGGLKSAANANSSTPAATSDRKPR